MKAGRMRSVIDVFEPVKRESAYGSTTVTYESRGRWHAERVSLSGRRVEEASELFADYGARYNIRDRHRIAPGWQLTGDDGLRYTVTAVEPCRWLGMLTLICERLNP